MNIKTRRKPGLHIPATPAGLEPVTSAVTGRRSNQLSYGAICTSMKHKRIYYSITGPRRAARRVAPRQCQAHPLPLQAIATPAIPALPIPWYAVVWHARDRHADGHRMERPACADQKHRPENGGIPTPLRSNCIPWQSLLFRWVSLRDRCYFNVSLACPLTQNARDGNRNNMPNEY